MDEREYASIHALEETHWWYRGLHRLVIKSLKRHLEGSGKLVLDAGCGTGGLLENLSERHYATGIDYSLTGLKFCQTRGLKKLARATVTALPFKDKTFDALTSLDVLYHSGVGDDADALKEFYRVLKDNGLMVLNLPAYEFLRSQHDVVIHTKRRYTRGSLKKKVEGAGFKVEKITYRNSLLFPLVAGAKLAKRFAGATGHSSSDLAPPPKALNNALYSILKLENRLLRLINLPFGTSVFCVARKS